MRARYLVVVVGLALASCRGRGGGGPPPAAPREPPATVPVAVGVPVAETVAPGASIFHSADLVPGIAYVVAITGLTAPAELTSFGADATFSTASQPCGASSTLGPRQCPFVATTDRLYFRVNGAGAQDARLVVVLAEAPLPASTSSEAATFAAGTVFTGEVATRGSSGYLVTGLTPGMNVTLSLLAPTGDADIGIGSGDPLASPLPCEGGGGSIVATAQSCTVIAAGTTLSFGVSSGPLEREGARYVLVAWVGHGRFRVVRTSPAAGATTAEPDAPIVFTFSELVDPATLSAGTVSVSAGGVPIPGSFEATGNVATFSPSAPLAWATPHGVSLGAGVRDAGGAALAPYAFGFTVRPALTLSLEALPPAIATVRGGTAAADLLLTTLAGAPEPVALAIAGCPPGATCTALPDVALLRPVSLAPFTTLGIDAEATTLRVVTTDATPAGSYPMEVAATWSTGRASATITLEVRDPPAAGAPRLTWGDTGAGLAGAPGTQAVEGSISDGAGGAFVVWGDHRLAQGSPVLHAQRVDARGMPLWDPAGVVVAVATRNGVAPSSQREAALAPDGAGGVVIAFEDDRSGQDDVWAQRLDASGARLWGDAGAPVATACWAYGGCSNQKGSVQIAADGAGGAFVAWDELRDGLSFAVWAQHVGSDGAPIWTVNGVSATDAASGGGMTPKIVADGAGGAILLWEEGSMIAQRLAGDGTRAWGADGVALGPGLAQRGGAGHALVSDGAGGAIAVWVRSSPGPIPGSTSSDVHAQRVAADGSLPWGVDGVPLCTAPGHQYTPAAIADGAGGAIAAWEDQRDPTTGVWIVAQRVSASGAPLWIADGVPLYRAHGFSPVLVPDGAGGAIVAWGGSGPTVRAQRVDPAGAPLWPDGGTLVYYRPDNHYYFAPRLAPAGVGTAIVHWYEDRFPPAWWYDVFGQRITDDAASAARAPAPGPAGEPASGEALGFEPNLGQLPAEARFGVRAPGGAILLAPDAIAFRTPAATIRTRLAGARTGAELRASGPPAGRAHHLRGRDPSRWITGVPRYARVRTSDAYPGIDVEYYGTGGRLEQDFVVRPGGDPRAIELAVDGAQARLDRGELVLATGSAELRWRAPAAYQLAGDRRRPVPVSFALRGSGRVGFEVGAYDRSATLVIDPIVSWSTPIAGIAPEDVGAVAIDSAGAFYLAGSTASLDLATSGSLQPALAGLRDAVVVKVAPDGRSVLWATYLGGSDGEGASGVAVGADGAVYVAGSTHSSDFPTTETAFRRTCVTSAYGGCDGGFVARIAPDGSALEYSTYVYGGEDTAHAIAGWNDVWALALAAGRPCVSGTTTSPTFPVTPDAFQATFGGATDAFVACFDTAASGEASLAYATYVGGSGSEDGYALGADAAGRMFLGGSTDSDDFPVVSALQPVHGGFREGFVVGFRPDGGAAYATYLGGSDTDAVLGLATDGAGSAWVTGQTKSSDFPVANAIIPEPPGGPLMALTFGDAFVTGIDPSGRLRYSTYLGGSSWDWGTRVVVDAAGNAFVAGATYSSDFPVLAGALETLASRSRGEFVTALAPDGSAVYSTYLPRAVPSGPVAALGSGDLLLAGQVTAASGSALGLARLSPQGAGKSDLGVSVSATAERDGVGTFRYVVSNGGPSDATGVVLWVATPAGARLTGCAPACDLGTIPAGGSVAVDLGLVPWDAGGTFDTLGFALGNQDDFHPENDLAGTSLAIPSSDLVRSVSASPELLGQGDAVVYVAAVRNDGPDPAAETLLALDLPYGTAVDALEVAGASCAPVIQAGGTDVSCEPLTLAPGATATLRVEARALAATGGTAWVQASSMSFDPLNGPLDEVPFAGVAVVPAELDMDVAPSGAAVTAGETATFTVDLAARVGTIAGPVSFACSGLPPGASCTFAPAEVVVGNGRASTTVTITVPRAPAGHTDAGGPGAGFLPFALGGLLAGAGLRRRRAWPLLVLALAAVAPLACDSGSGSGAGLPFGNPPPAGGTAGGTYSVTISATSAEEAPFVAALTRFATVTLVVR